MNLPDDLAEWRDKFLADHGLTLADLVNDGFESQVTAIAERMERTTAAIPIRFAGARVTEPAVRDWLAGVYRQAIADRRVVCSVTAGPSLLILGPTGCGKTYQAYGMAWAFASCGVRAAFQCVSAADLYAKMRPRHGVDSEEEFRRYAEARPLIVDDLGAAKGSEWTEEINYRLVNYRYENSLPTVFTSNVLPRDLAGALGERVASRLNEMAVRVSLKGADRRYGSAA